MASGKELSLQNSFSRMCTSVKSSHRKDWAVNRALVDEPVDEKKSKNTVVLEVAPRTAHREPSHDDRSLHASDLLPGTLGTDNSFPIAQRQQQQQKRQQQQQHSNPRVIHVEEWDSEISEASLQNTYSVEERRGEASAMGAEEKEDPRIEEDRLDIEGDRNEAVEPQQPTKIQVTLPSIDNNVLEESSVASDLHVSVDQDTFGDVSSISGGEF